ncbi:MAG: DUF4317 domain-containing protein [Eubacteriales bacterium]
MNKRDILELKRRFKKTDATFTKVCGCYVNSEKHVIVTLDEIFLNLDDEELHKYLEIAKKTLSGSLGNNLLELDFPLEEEGVDGKQQFLLGLRDSNLKNEELLQRFYEHVIDTYQYLGNYLILLFHDAYDVITKTNDNMNIDESEEVYQYLLCAICPVSLSKPGLGYREDENRIGARIRDWIVGVPDVGFVFPAFTERSSDIHSLMYYTKNTKEPDEAFMEFGLGCPSKPTATQQKVTFQEVVKKTVGADEQLGEQVLFELQQNLKDMVTYKEEMEGKNADPILLTPSTIQTALEDSQLSNEVIEKVELALGNTFAGEPPIAELLIDEKSLAAHEQKAKEQSLIKEVHSLKEKLTETTAQIEEEQKEYESVVKTYDVILKVKPDKVSQIKSQTIDGQKCLVIPMEEDEFANVNGVTTKI